MFVVNITSQAIVDGNPMKEIAKLQKTEAEFAEWVSKLPESAMKSEAELTLNSAGATVTLQNGLQIVLKWGSPEWVEGGSFRIEDCRPVDVEEEILRAELRGNGIEA